MHFVIILNIANHLLLCSRSILMHCYCRHALTALIIFTALFVHKASIPLHGICQPASY